MDVIHNGVEQDIFKPVDKERKAALRSRLSLPQDKHIFISAGFLSKGKDPVTIIKAFLASKASRSAVLVLLGDGTLRDKCLRMAGANDNIRIVGFAENVREYLGAADTFVSASLTEGCPNAVMEALACSLPVILSDIPAHREILAYGERAGLTFPVKDVASLSEILSRTKNMNYSEQSTAALSIIKNHLNARNMSLKYQELYTQLHDQAVRRNSES
jgi:glycosyltransferase involved in cell wall biosynthesis